jgi:hypothetical protein
MTIGAFFDMKASILHLGAEAAKPPGMDNSISSLDNKVSFSLLAILTVAAAAIMAKVRATFNAQAPEGFEDEAGFHYGSE